MLDINMEFRKGILFIRLSGSLSKENCILLDEKLQHLVNNKNVRFITFNVANLDYIDLDGSNIILKYSKALLKIKGKALICGVDNSLVRTQIDSNLNSKLSETKDELSAINYIKLGGYI